METPRTEFYLILLFLFYHLPCVPSQKQPTVYCETPFQCGNITVGFPFSGEQRSPSCGHPFLKLSCNKSSNTTSINLSGYNYTVLHIDMKKESLTLRLSRQDFTGPFCSASFSSSPLPQDLLQNLPSYKSLTVFYTCDTRRHFLGNFTCRMNNLVSVVQDSRYNKLCDKRFSVTVPASYVPEEEALNITRLESVLREGFEAKLNMEEIPCPECLSTGENCGFIVTGMGCCKYVSGSIECRDSNNDTGSYSMNRFILITIGTGSVVIAFLVMILVFLLCERRKKKALRKQNLEALVTSRLYSYRQIKKITKSFSEVVGRGGFGTVYKGKLRDGSKVAVKVLKDSMSSSEDFINEVASISQTSHVNIVSLLGFCYEGSKRAIVYEFVENGSLDQSMNLDVSTLYGIALGVAKGIEYLHYGCRTRIVHFDIKPQNVLLDHNLRPKVSDFGLAKLCQNQESILSSLDTRGTIGYIAPELFSRMYGSVSYKSDVYSYGMLLLEMIGANKERVGKSDSNKSSVYFPDWIYKDLESGDITMLLEGELNQEEEDIAKKMIIVGLWCIQLCPSDRPTMNEVIEMMEGSLDTLKAPPKPLLHMSMQNISESSQLSGESSIYSEV
ncbi:LEAF RUST 10 DISEASE-RESISTANCE LOCUS RECEPTOR-LIKE PROTEIN KINASE-like 2.3 isoform X2 [Raphanus sativus]|uniref:LEAF RUST 10 DISEASE-RESISTANCE LOCUS RECEPTOR-LIKE PROTEIN KINASE-like 2.3 isoform X2 n=1 Tax=Raphanus sativus TaxID=3726 RepID=A0A9W3DI62_RAPSA|nr:LEAF RUST 10 DISEASE-RESISTANCE LOCUS RECEPTOR-LIKE PROTEIN KINASE-like 2.3 isoform X2 [Raphanus sativus]